MNVLHFTWEFPPFKVGGIASHVEDLTRAQAKVGLTPIIVTCSFCGQEGYEEKEGVHIFRFNADDIPAEDFPSWVLEMNLLMQNQVIKIFDKFDKIEILHSHDWLSATSAISIKHMYRIPLIATMHSMEIGRRGAIRQDRERLIDDIERRLVYESWRTIVCSHFMKNSICSCFYTPDNKVDIIPNGIYPEKYELNFNYESIKMKFAMPFERIVLFVGRLVWEKGADLLIGAAPQILSKIPEAKFVFVGKGYMRNKCMEIANSMGIKDKVYFSGYLNDDELIALYNIAEVVAVPSRYEPFGIVALEAMAAKTPVLVSSAGGLSEVADGCAYKVGVEKSDEIADGILDIMTKKELKTDMIENGFLKINTIYNWNVIASTTKKTYQRVIEEYQHANWKPKIKNK
ncbi:MAG: glycosyltransferase family 1 protein [Candidatus Nanohalarchaeota archaeon]|nr:MAG: glycosyltransferase family 1 protein [Candidatus Nanohaloarchaeota archaeon]